MGDAVTVFTPVTYPNAAMFVFLFVRLETFGAKVTRLTRLLVTLWRECVQIRL